ncbi:PEP/pyruvate-binding domain-containing protein [Streptomyces sp. NPDC093595]|uniref:PEP/pyruvate-binding domain-containing protein n=1 Tax=Streptomyces sp. NPDC093595 TaxID=3366045 RepID=UPI003827CE29
MKQSPDLVVDGAGLCDPMLVGHKFARQYQMQLADLPVPAFFCLTGEAFQNSVPAVGGFPGMEASNAELITWANAAHEHVRGIALPAQLADRILDQFDAMVGAEGKVAVRACAVATLDGAGEDGADDPFAGLSDSFLYVDRATVLARVADCWASLYNPEAVLYRVSRGVDPREGRIAVGIQLMVPGVRSFVVFTGDPRGATDGRDQMVVAAAHGIGEGIVQEKADIDHYFVDRATDAVEARVVHKAVMVGVDPDRPAGTTQLSVPPHLSEAPVLSDPDILLVCQLARMTERLFSGPQDIEGTITSDGAIHLVQSRPVVLSNPAPHIRPNTEEAENSTYQAPSPQVPWTNHNLTESFPGLTGALTYSQARTFYRVGFEDFYRRMGVAPRSLRRNRNHLDRMIGYLDGRVYYRLDAWYALHGQIPGFPLMRPLWERSLGLTDSAHQPRELIRTARLRLALKLPRLAWLCARQPSQLRSFMRWWDRLASDSSTLDTCSPEELITRYRRLWAEAEQHWGITLVTSYFGLAGLSIAQLLLRRWAPESDSLMPRLVAAGKPNRTVLALRSTITLAELVNAQPDLRSAVLERSEREVWDEITAGAHGAETYAAFRQHLVTYGDRALHDLKLEVLTPRQEPWMLLSTLKPFVTQGTTVAGSIADEQRTRREAREALQEACRSPLRRSALNLAFAFLRFAVKAREDTRFCRSQLYGISRDVLRRLAEHLTASGMLDRVEDVFHLQVEEVLGAFDGTLPATDLRGLVHLRRTALDQAAEAGDRPAYFSLPRDIPVPVALAHFHDEATPATDATGAQELLHGMASSTGVIRARAKVVLDPTVAPEDCADRILVARETDPGWLPLMMVAKGLVVERGSLVSHTAISGRILGIPTLVAVENATRAIPDGAWIELDAGSGTVRVLSSSVDGSQA